MRYSEVVCAGLFMDFPRSGPVSGKTAQYGQSRFFFFKERFFIRFCACAEPVVFWRQFERKNVFVGFRGRIYADLEKPDQLEDSIVCLFNHPYGSGWNPDGYFARV